MVSLFLEMAFFSKLFELAENNRHLKFAYHSYILFYFRYTSTQLFYFFEFYCDFPSNSKQFDLFWGQ